MTAADRPGAAPAPAPSPAMGRAEFVAFLGMLFATVAFSTDAMLPALPGIAAELGPERANEAALVVITFIVGMGLGTFFTGPMSDAWGRKPVLYGGAALFIPASLAAWAAPDFDWVLVARFVQGLAAAAPRVVGQAIVRDLFKGRAMARIMSFAMIVFTLFPAVAPLIGAGIIALWGWRAIFLAFVLFSVISTGWAMLRLPETLPRERRRPLQAAKIREALAEMARRPRVRLGAVGLTLAFASIFAAISTIQQIFDQGFGRAESFPVWFFGMAIVGGTGSFLNAMLVVRLGMVRLVQLMLSAQVALSTAMLAVVWLAPPEPVYFALTVIWLTSLFFQAGMTIGNLSALTMEPLGHIAGIATSALSAVATIGAGILAAPVALLHDGTPLSLALGTLAFAAGGLGVVGRLRTGSRRHG